MKKLCYSAFIAFWSSVATIWALHALAADQAGDQEGATRVYSLAEVQQHDSADDCWLIIESQVYDISSYLGQHPAPPSVLLPWCGSEATEGMRTKGYGNDHSPAAWELLENYHIGEYEP